MQLLGVGGGMCLRMFHTWSHCVSSGGCSWAQSTCFVDTSQHCRCSDEGHLIFIFVDECDLGFEAIAFKKLKPTEIMRSCCLSTRVIWIWATTPSLVLTGLTIAPIVVIPGMIPSKQSIVVIDPDHQFNCYDLVGTCVAVQGQVVECVVICKRMRRCGWWMVDLLLSHHCRLDATPKLILKFEHMNQTILVSGFAKLNFWTFVFLARIPQLYASNHYTIRCSCSENNVPIWLAPGGSQCFPRNLQCCQKSLHNMHT